MGGVGLTGNGTLHVGWTRSSGSGGDFPSSYTAHQSVGADAGSLSAEAQISAGTGNYPGTRWGDYVGIAQDPQVPNQAWDGNQYSGGGSGWKTKITSLQTQGTTYVPITPVRVLNTRTSTGGLQGGFTSNNPRSWQVSGVGGIPAEAVAVTGNVTVTGQTAAGFVAITVTSTSTPPSSTINFPATGTRANNVTIPLTAGGKLSAVYKTSKAGKKTQLLFDVTGYFLADSTAATYTPLPAPFRALNTRANTGLTGVFHANQSRTLVIGGSVPGVPTSATAITGNLTIVGPTVAGFVSVTKDPTNAPSTSTINFPAKSVRANGIFAPLDLNHALSIVYGTSGSGSTNVILDITGYFEPGTGGLLFVPMAPSRILNSRTTSVLSGIHGKFVAATPRALAVQGHWGVPSTALAVTGNLTVTGQTGAGYVSATPTSIANPTTSTINFPVGDTMANGLVAPLNGSGQSWFVYGSSAGKTTDLILDLSGYFEP